MNPYKPAFSAAIVAVIPLLLLSLVQASDDTGQSARRALEALAKNKGAHYLGRVLMVEGRFGNHQPKAWRVLAFDPQIQGRLREFMINGDRIDSERLLLAWRQGRRVPLREVTIDSSDAFLRADLAAKDAKVGFDSLDYQLIMPGEGREPLWLVTLVGSTGEAVGEVQVGARTGTVMRKAWPKPGAPVVQPDRGQRPAPPVERVKNTQRSGNTSVKTRQPSATDRDGQPKPHKLASAKPARTQPSQVQPPALPGSQDAPSIKEASGQLLEGARQGIIRTGGSVRDFFKGLQEKQ